MNRRWVRWVVTPLALPLAVAASVMIALAYWTAPGTGSATASSGSLAAATISVPGSSFNSVTVTWSQQASLVPSSAANSAITYSVERKLGSGSWAAVSTGACSGTKPHGTTSCVDTLPASGSYGYRVVATYATWSATSAEVGPVAVTIDLTGPTGGSVDATGLVGTSSRYSTSTALSIALAKGTDPAGLASTGAKLRRASATLTSGGTANGSCGTYGAFVQIGADDPASPVADTVPAGQACYRYEYVVRDTPGNSTTYTSPDIKIDTTAPGAPGIGVSALTNAYLNGLTLYYRSNATSGGFTVSASATDTTSGIASYTFPTLPSGWTATPGAFGVVAYSWSSANPTAPSGAQNVTATNHATLTSAATGATMVSDVTAPATGTVSYTDGYYTSTSVGVSFTAGTDGGSGVKASSGELQRAEATLTPATGACGTYGAFATVTGGTNPSSPFTDTTVTNTKCYQYRYLISDNVGNQATYTNANVAKVDTSPPPAPTAVSVTSGGNVVSGAACTIASGTRYINNAGTAAVGVSATIPTPETGESVVFSATTPGSTPVTVTVAAAGTSVAGTMNLSTLLDGTVTLTARTKDAAGNLSTTLGPTNTIIKDVVAGALSGLSYNDRILQPDQILGTSECGATIVAVKSGGSTYTSSVLTSSSFTLNVQAQALSTYSYNVTATDLAGNTSAIIVVSGSAFL